MAITPVKHIEVRSFARGSVYITDPQTTASPDTTPPPSATNETNVAWGVYRLSTAAAGDYVKTSMYLPRESLMYAGNYIKVEPNAVVGRLDGFGYCELRVQGQLMCSLYKDANGETKAELRVGPRQGAFFSFLVCEVSGSGDGGLFVTQFASGTVIVPSETAAGPFQVKLGANGAVAGFGDGFVQVGGKTVEVTGTSTPPGENEFVAVRIPATANPSESASVQYYADLAALNAAQEDPAYVIVPLYKLGQVATGEDSDEDSDEETITAIVMDMRQMPFAQMAEVLV